MADVTISGLSRGYPNYTAVLPYSIDNGTGTYKAHLSAIFQHTRAIAINGAVNPDSPIPIASLKDSTIPTAVPDLRISDSSSQWLHLNTNCSAGSWTSLSKNNDIGLVYSTGTIDTGSFFIGQWSTSLRGIRIDSSGNVGIGTATPTAKLDVAGTVRATGDVKADSGYIDTTGTTVSLANNAYIDFPLASGLLIVNAHGPIDGSVSAYLVGGTGVVRLGTSIGTPSYTVTFVNPNPGPPFYRFTNTSGSTNAYGFCFIKTRPYA